AWAVDWPRARGRRWRARILASGRRGMAADARPALLGHKTANVLNKLPSSQQPKAKRALQEIWMAEKPLLDNQPLPISQENQQSSLWNEYCIGSCARQSEWV